jgi:hypothetical protein
MADTRVQLEIEDWVREFWMAERFGRPFFRNRIKLSSGGYFDFDAVSEDKTIAACISTSGAQTSSGKNAVGKMMKLRSDMLFLMMAEGLTQRLMILTDETMHVCCEKEMRGGRVPREITFVHAEIPEALRTKLLSARQLAAREVMPEKNW